MAVMMTTDFINRYRRDILGISEPIEETEALLNANPDAEDIGCGYWRFKHPKPEKDTDDSKD